LEKTFNYTEVQPTSSYVVPLSGNTAFFRPQNFKKYRFSIILDQFGKVGIDG